MNGEMTGKGIRSYNDKSLYEGEFVKGKKHGFGKLKFSNGDVYEGM